MTFSSGFHMPGAFHADGIHQGLFRPPVSPASSSGYLPPVRSTAAEPTPKRKRFRDDRKQQLEQSEQSHDAVTNFEQDESSMLLITPAARQAHNGRTYTLAGQLDTPNGGPGDSELLGESMYSDSNYRKALGSKRSRDEAEMSDGTGPTRLFNLPPTPQRSPGWSSLAFSTLGGVVGKVWEFCKTGAFKGFYAGGGRGFDMQPGDGMYSDNPAHDQGWQQNDQLLDDDQRIPGHFPQYDSHYYPGNQDEQYLDSGSSTPSAPAAKRRQTAPMDELGRNWVIVKDQRNGAASTTPRKMSASYKPSPRNRNQGPSAATGRRISTPNNRRSSTKLPSSAASYRPPTHAESYNLSTPNQDAPRPASSASFASPRSPSPIKTSSQTTTVGSSTLSPTPSSSRGHARRRSANPSTGRTSFTHSRTHSGASTASSRGAPDDLQNSPRLDAEAKHLAARRQREERNADFRITAFNKQLQDMIRQGKEALGTTVEVEGEEGGWENDL